jgi:hypothetical protein
MQPVHEILKLVAIHSPHALAADLDSWQLARAHQSVNLGDTYVQILCRLLKREEARLNRQLSFVKGAFTRFPRVTRPHSLLRISQSNEGGQCFYRSCTW